MDISCATEMAVEHSSILIQAERELRENEIKHKTLLKEYVRLAGFEQSGSAGCLGTSTLALLLKNNRQVMAQQRTAYKIKSKCSDFLQNVHNVKDNHKTVKKCVKQVNSLHVPNAKSTSQMCKKLLKKKVLLQKSNDNIERLSDMLDELSVDDCDSDAEDDMALQKDLTDYKQGLLMTLPLPPLSEGELDSNLDSQSDGPKNFTEDDKCQ